MSRDKVDKETIDGRENEAAFLSNDCVSELFKWKRK